MANTRHILVIAGDYDIIDASQRALLGEGFSLQKAYTHRDALYALGQNRFDAVLVDAAMHNRHTGQSTAATVSQTQHKQPIIAVAPNGVNTETLEGQIEGIITSLNSERILDTVRQVLRGPSKTSRLDESQAATSFRELRDDSLLAQRIQENKTLFALSKSLTEVLDTNEVLNRVVEAARRLTGADEGMILLPDEEAGELLLRAKVGIDVEVARNFRIKTQDTLAGQVLSSGKPVLVGDQGPQKVKTEYFVNSLLYVPILLLGKPIGVLGVNNRNNPQGFDPHHQELLVNLASFAAIALENARIHEDSLKRARELGSLVRASQVLNSSLYLGRTALNICEQLAQVLNVNRTEIYEWNIDENRLRTLARYQRVIWPYGQGRELNLDRRPALTSALENDSYLWLTPMMGEETAETRYIQQVGAEVMLVIPISTNQQVLGAVLAYYSEAPDERPGDEALLHTRRLALEGLMNILNEADQIRPQSIFRLMQEINRLNGTDWCELSLLAPDEHSLQIQAEVGKGFWLSAAHPSLDLQDYPDLQEILENQEPVNHLIGEDSYGPGVRALFKNTRARALLILPLIQGGETRGIALFSDTDRKASFGQREIDLGQAIAGQTATALENARLVLDLELSLQELKDTQERLIQAARLSAMGELAAVVAHQINNPLTTIVVDAELMLLDEQEDSPNRRALEAIIRAGKRSASVARRLLSVARPNDPDAPLGITKVTPTR